MQDLTPRHDNLSPEDRRSPKSFPRWSLDPPAYVVSLLCVWFGFTPDTHAASRDALSSQQASHTHSYSRPTSAHSLHQVRWFFRSEQSIPQEVKGSETLTLHFQVSHRHQEPKAYLVYRNVSSRLFNREHKIPIQEPGLFHWSLKKLPFGPGDLVEYFIEVESSNSLLCTRRRRTSRRYLKFFSPIEQHSKLLQKEKQFLHQMVDLLADLIEAQIPPSGSPFSFRHLRKLHVHSLRLQAGLRKLYHLALQDQMSRSYSLTTLKTLALRLQQRHHKRSKILRSVVNGSSLCLRPTKQRLWKKLLQSEIRGHENDIHAVRQFLFQQENDLIDLLRKRLTRAHKQSQRLAYLYKRYHHSDLKRSLSASLQHLDRLLRYVKRHIK